MLTACLPESLGIAKEMRHSYQSEVAEMVHSVLIDEEKKLGQKIEEANTALEKIKLEQASKASAHQGAKVLAETHAEDIAAKTTRLSQDVKEQKTQELTLEKAEAPDADPELVAKKEELTAKIAELKSQNEALTAELNAAKAKVPELDADLSTAAKQLKIIEAAVKIGSKNVADAKSELERFQEGALKACAALLRGSDEVKPDEHHPNEQDPAAAQEAEAEQPAVGSTTG